MSKSENDGAKQDRPNYVGIVKWGVIGVLGMVSLVLFREPLAKLLGKASEVSITGDGVTIKTTETPLGVTVVSRTTVAAESSGPVGLIGNRFVDRKRRFQISWPEGTSWEASESLGKRLHAMMGLSSATEVPLVIVGASVGDFTPNVNIVVDTVDAEVTIARYVEDCSRTMYHSGWTVLSASVDEATQGGFLTFLNNMLGKQVYQFQRIVVADGRAYVITASQLPPDKLLTQKLRGELRGILNSFSLLVARRPG